MQYVVDTIINKPVEEVVSLFDSTENLKEWLEGLEKFEHLEGNPGDIGAKSQLTFKMGDKDLVMVETIASKDLPGEFTATYEMEGVFNTIKTTFHETGADQTRMSMDSSFEFQSFPMKIMAFFAPFIFKKQTRKNLEAFRAFAERN